MAYTARKKKKSLDQDTDEQDQDSVEKDSSYQELEVGANSRASREELKRQGYTDHGLENQY